MPTSARRTAFNILKAVSAGAYADVALQRHLSSDLKSSDRSLATELAYGVIRRQRTLNTLITQFASKPAHKQPPELRWILQLGLYQLRYLTQIPQSAAIHSTVELAKQLKLGGLSKVVNGILRQYQRQSTDTDPLVLPKSVISELGVTYSYPDWIIKIWIDQLGESEARQLCEWMSASPSIDLRVNCLTTHIEELKSRFQEQGLGAKTIDGLPQALRLTTRPGRLTALPGFKEGEWMVQDASAQLVSHVLDPQPNWKVLDLCAAPGGKTIHLSELMDGHGDIWACEPIKSRIKRIRENCDRLKIKNVTTWQGDGRDLPTEMDDFDAILVDAPCSGLGTLHRHADARWRQTPDGIQKLAKLQQELLASASTRVKDGGRMVYSTCTLHPDENESVVNQFIDSQSEWELDPVPNTHYASRFETDRPGLYKVWPHQSNMDGFFLARMRKKSKEF